ncbi:phosphatidylinositol N-acetylglucosaminyltransferase subunit C [Raphidocelis subcapitata]|uniref:Phosphatidylinositol N-acetylglucosaminyltransferase subunit C n=1 Tax=Raphidocelis subcapitata TaxID=307507 RepID=A0A2V0P556_9CHLO|nr:phosphatidylinositol N-acetylglucosaminyltransferase subunit C [Raphidocelis subcapitata]|eukprot:GBF92993.1 phosphatidylinositol N-acetylglucosaminyltransferase subunit C [Raphidocelis subcapitata]
MQRSRRGAAASAHPGDVGAATEAATAAAVTAARGTAAATLPRAPSAAAQPAGPVWEKVLWRRQPYPDNYTDPTFLQALVVNADVPRRAFARVALGSAAVTQQLSAVAAALAVAAHLRLGAVSAGSVLALSAGMLLFGYAICCFVGGHVLGGSLRRGLRQVTLLTGGVYLLAPMLRTLTKTVSEDSVVAMTAGLLVLHLYLHDYNFVNSVTDKPTGAVSLSAAVFSSVLIASCMPSEMDVFAHVLFCLQLYLLSPFMRRYVRAASLGAHAGLTAAMAAAAAALLAPLSPALACVFGGLVLFVSLACPWWLVHIHKFKAKINGPWDEAVPQVPTHLMEAGGGGGGGGQ